MNLLKHYQVVAHISRCPFVRCSCSTEKSDLLSQNVLIVVRNEGRIDYLACGHVGSLRVVVEVVFLVLFEPLVVLLGI